MSGKAVTLIHLSDIHFRGDSGTDPYDLGTEIRNSLERDVIEVNKQLAPTYGVLVTGDLAFSGKEEEYKVAQEWLTRLCDLVGCPQENVWTIPGNHDIDLPAVDASMVIQDLRRTLRNTPLDRIDDEIRKRLRDPGAGRELFLPLKAYNKFADKFQCRTTAQDLWWQDKIELNDGSILRLRGINSVLVSDSRIDDDAANKLPLGSFQATVPEEDGVEYLIMCHHPPQWLKDQDTVEDWLMRRCRIQLFGHKHRQRVNNLNGTVRIAAGAMLPDKREPHWEPRYNFLSIRVKNEGDRRKFSVNIFPRVWSDTEKNFKADYDERGSDGRLFVLEIRNWQRPAPLLPRTNNMEEVSPTKNLPDESKQMPETSEGEVKNPARRLTYRFLSLSYQTRLEIAQNLRLIQDEDEGVDDSERYTRFFARARNKQKLEKLWQAVEQAHGATSNAPNPFKRK